MPKNKEKRKSKDKDKKLLDEIMNKSNMSRGPDGYVARIYDILDRKLPEEEIRDIALSMSIDMYDIHMANTKNKSKRFEILVDYFKNRKGLWDDECKKPEDMAMKMTLMGEVADLTNVIVKLTKCRPTDFKINFEICKNSAMGITVGIHKSVKERKKEILEKVVSIHVMQMLDKMKKDYPQIMMHAVDPNDKEAVRKLDELFKDEAKTEVKIDDEAKKVLDRMQWDKTSMGEA